MAMTSANKVSLFTCYNHPLASKNHINNKSFTLSFNKKRCWGGNVSLSLCRCSGNGGTKPPPPPKKTSGGNRNGDVGDDDFDLPIFQTKPYKHLNFKITRNEWNRILSDPNLSMLLLMEITINMLKFVGLVCLLFPVSAAIIVLYDYIFKTGFPPEEARNTGENVSSTA